MIEEWKEIEWLGWLYSVSNNGYIRNNKTGKKLNRNQSYRLLYTSTKINNKSILINIKKEMIRAFLNDDEHILYRNIDGNVFNLELDNLTKENRRYKQDKNNTYKIINDHVEVYTDNMETFLIDLEDLDLIENYKWYRRKDGYISCSTSMKKLGSAFLHRSIMSKYYDIKKMNIDHINRKRYDNRKENLRIVTTQQNNFNQSISRNNKTGIIGVSYKINNTKKHGVSTYWKAQIKYNGKYITKQFKTKEDATKWRLQKELECYGIDFAPQRHLFEKYNIN